MMTPDDLAGRLLEFAARVGKVVDALPDTRMGRHIAGQLVRAGTAAAPNYEEGRAAESKKDFIHKLGIALKELREARCWLAMAIRCELLPSARLIELTKESDELVRILAKSVATARKGASSNRR